MSFEDGAPASDTTVSNVTPDAGTQAPAPEPTIDETLRAKFKELTAPTEGSTAEGEEASGKPGAPVRDANGRFVKQGTAAPGAEQTQEEPAPEGEEVAAETAETPEQKAVREEAERAAEAAKPQKSAHEKAPSSWKADGGKDWDKVPESVRAEIYRREDDMHKGLQQYKRMADVGQIFDNEFRPYEAMIRAHNTTAPALVKTWLNTEYQLATGTPEKKAELFAQYAKSYGVDIEAIANAYHAGPAAPTPPDPNYVALQKEVADMKASREQEQREALERQQAELKAEIDAFASAKGHEHWETVKLDAAALLGDGRAKTLQEAYDMACWANPTVRKTLQAQQQEEQRKQAAEKAAAARKAASTNVATRGTPPARPVVGTIDDTLRSEYRRLTGNSAS
jgi:hypothetical protein